MKNSLSSKNFVLRLFVLTFVFALSGKTFAQKSLTDLAELKDRKWNKTVKSSYRESPSLGQLKGLVNEELLKKEDIKIPKKIGVIAMQIWDKSTTKSEKAGNWIFYTTNLLTNAGGNEISNKLKEVMLPAIERQFSQYQIEFIEPSEFLNSQDEMDIYQNGMQQVEASGLLRGLNAASKFLLRDTKASGRMGADGYAFCPVNARNVGLDFKAPASIGKVADALGLDAVIIIDAEVSLERRGRSLVLHNLGMTVVDTPDDDTSKTFSGVIGAGMMNKYRDGLTMGYAYTNLGKQIEIAELQKKTHEITEWNLEGLEEVAYRMAGDVYLGMQSYVNMEKNPR